MKERTMRAALVVFACFVMLSGFANAQTDFHIQSIQRNTDGTITLAWPALAGRTYHVMSADTLDDWWWDFPDGHLTAGTNDLTLSYTDVFAPVAAQRFYRVRRDPAQLVMTLVLDRSGSMRGPPGQGGGAYLAPAVTDFISHFDDNTDRAAMVSFATMPSVNVPMGHPFKSVITSAVNNLVYAGATFAQGGLTNALVQNNSVPGGNVVKVVVFFTDGLANVIQVTLNCPPQTMWNVGGFDSGSFVGFFDPNTGNELCDLASGGSPACCAGANGFTSAIDGTLKSFVRTNVTADGEYRTVQVANDMRAAGMYVYSIGLGSGVNVSFLQQVANDPNSPTFNPTQPVGLAVISSSPADLQVVFEQIASQILAY
jgi:hypothetical protein